MGGRSAEALARRAAKRGLSVEDMQAKDLGADGDKKRKLEAGSSAAEPAAAKSATTAVSSTLPTPVEMQPAVPQASKPPAPAADGTKEHRPKQPLPSNHLKSSKRNGAKRKKAKEEFEAKATGTPAPEPRKAAPPPPKPPPAEAKPSAAPAAAAPASADGPKRPKASTRDGLVVWLKGSEPPVPMIIRKSELREPPEPRASPKFLWLEPVGGAAVGGAGAQWAHSAAVLPLDALLAEQWRAHGGTDGGGGGARRAMLRKAVLQQQRALPHLSVAQLWAQLVGDNEEPWPEK